MTEEYSNFVWKFFSFLMHWVCWLFVKRSIFGEIPIWKADVDVLIKLKNSERELKFWLLNTQN